MNFKGLSQLIVPFLLAVLTYFAVRSIVNWISPSFFNSGQTQVTTDVLKPGEAFPYTKHYDMHRPPETEFNFESEQADFMATKTLVQTAYGALTFSSDGAVLEKFDYQFNKDADKNSETLNIYDTTQNIKDSTFLFVFKENTPRYYTLLDRQETDTHIVLTYKTTSKDISLVKEFTIAKKNPRVDLRIIIEKLSIAQKTPGAMPTLRISAPILPSDDVKTMSGFLFVNDSFKKYAISDFSLAARAPVTIAGLEDRFFAIALINDSDKFLTRIDPTGTEPRDFKIIFEGVSVDAIKVPTSWNMSFYIGPKDLTVLSAVDQRLEKVLDYGWLSPLVKILLRLLNYLYSLVQNYGWAILLLSLLIRLLLIPMTYKGTKALEKQKEYQKKLQYIEQKYKFDNERLTQERAELTKKYGLSNMLGCVPQLIQLPVLFALNKLLATSVLLYKAPFIGWITDLSVKDPYYIFPILSGIGILIQLGSESDAKRNVTMFMLASGLVVMTAFFPAGVTLYLAANTWLGLAQVFAQKKLKF